MRRSRIVNGLFTIGAWLLLALIASNLHHRFFHPKPPPTPQDLFDAAERGDIAAVKRLLDRGFNPNVRYYGRTAMMAAAQYGHNDMINLLLLRGADVNAQVDSQSSALFESTALMDAARYGHLDTVYLLLRRGAYVNAQDQSGNTALTSALSNANTDCAKLLLDFGASAKLGTPLAAIASDPPPPKPGLYRLTDVVHPLGSVVAHTIPDMEIVRILLQRGAKVNAANPFRQTALELAAENGHEDMVRELLAHGDETNHHDKLGYTPLFYAVMSGYTKIVQMLLAHGAEVNTGDSHGKTTLLQAASGNHLEVVKLLLAHGANVNANDDSGETPLLFAMEKRNQAMTRLLRAAGAQLLPKHFGARSAAGRAALRSAVNDDEVEHVKVLLQMGADPNQREDPNDQPILMTAINDHHSDVAKLLIDRGADVNARNKDGRTVLQSAIYYGNAALVKLLLADGADVNASGDFNGTPMHTAIKRGHRDIIALLQQAGATE